MSLMASEVKNTHKSPVGSRYSRYKQTTFLTRGVS